MLEDDHRQHSTKSIIEATHDQSGMGNVFMRFYIVSETANEP